LLGIGWFLARDWLALYPRQLGCYLATVTVFLLANILAMVRIRSQIMSFGIFDETMTDAGTDYLRVLRFSLPILIPPTVTYSLSFLSHTLLLSDDTIYLFIYMSLTHSWS
jgi:hypothetical protein